MVLFIIIYFKIFSDTGAEFKRDIFVPCHIIQVAVCFLVFYKYHFSQLSIKLRDTTVC